MSEDRGTDRDVPFFTWLMQKLVNVKRDEVAAVFLSAAYYFFVLSAYYIIRPIRDEMGAAGGVDNLPWLFTGTLVGMILVNPLFSSLVAKYPRKRFIPMAYRFFILNLVIFFLLLRSLPDTSNIWIGRAFFVWVSVFNLFVVSVFWSFMADIFRSEQGKRLFAFIALGGTLGAILGSSITAFFAELIGPVNLLLMSGVFLEIAVQSARWLGNRSRDSRHEPEAEPADLSALTVRTAAGTVGPRAERPIGGGILAGISHVFASPYLLGICVFMLLFTIGSTFLYFQQAEIVTAAITDRAARTAMFAKIDLLVNILTIVMQVFVTGRILKWFGVAFTLALLPALSVFGFLALGLMPTLGVVIAVQVARRAGNFAVARPTREVLFTVISREDKYKAKNFIDTFVYRGGDQVGAWSYSLMGWLGLGVAGIAFAAVPISVLWVMISIWLGRRQTALASREEAGEPPAAEPAIA